MRDLTDDVARKRAAACGRYPGEPPDFAVMRLEYFQDNGWELDLDHPVDIASKLHWLKAFYRDERYPVMADKLAARDIVRQAAGDAYLSELHWSGARLPAARRTASSTSSPSATSSSNDERPWRCRHRPSCSFRTPRRPS